VGVLGVLLLVLFVLWERGPTDGVLPPKLFRNRVFAVSATVSMIVGFALFGAVTFLPLFFQTVNGESPTNAGLRLTPMMLGVLLTSIGSGQFISRVGRYKVFPVVGTFVMIVGFVLLSGMDRHTSTLDSSLRLVVLGIGLGLTMQVLVLATQNAVDYAELGVATSGVTLFRTIGGAIGTSVFGTIFANQLGAGGGEAARPSPDALARLPDAARIAFLDKYTDALSVVFLSAGGVAAVAFVLSWLLPEKPLRDTVSASGSAEHFATPRAADSLAEIERALAVLADRDTRRALYRDLASRAGLDLPPLASWTLARLGEDPQVTPAELCERHGVDADLAEAAYAHLVKCGYVEDGWLTAAGDDALERLRHARRERLAERLDGWSPEKHEEIGEALTRLARDLPPEPVGVG
jgi:hypothetical protein